MRVNSSIRDLDSKGMSFSAKGGAARPQEERRHAVSKFRRAWVGKMFLLRRKSTLSAVPVPDTGATGTTPTDVCRGWKSVNAIVMGNHEIQQRTAMHIPVSVPNATVGCDLCLEGPSRVNTLAIESTLNTVREGGWAVVLVVNTTDGPVKLRNGVFLGRALASGVTKTVGVTTYSCRRSKSTLRRRQDKSCFISWIFF